MTQFALALVAALLCQEKFDEKKHPWTKWKVGAFAEYKLSGAFGEQKLDGTMTQKLLEKSKTGYKTLQLQSIMGQEQKEEENETFPVADGTETLTVDGQKMECTIWKSKGKKGEKDTETRVWVPKGGDIPVKMSSASGDEFLATKLSENVPAGDGKEYNCVVLKGKLKSENGDMEAEFYFSPKVPGGIVKIAMKLGEQGNLSYDLTKWEDGK